MSTTTLTVPNDAHADIELIAECLREALREANAPSDEVKVLRSDQRALTMDAVGDSVFLIVASSAAVWFTKKWADAYLWPAIQRRIDAPSRELIDWIFGPDEE